MKKFVTCAMFLTVLAAMTAPVWAQNPPAGGSVLWFDVRDDALTQTSITTPKTPWVNGDGDSDLPFAAVINAGKNGGGQVLRLSPTTSNNMQLNSSYPGAAPALPWPNYDGDGNLSTGDLWLYFTMDNNNDSPLGTQDVMTSIGININSAQVQAGVTRNQMASLSFGFLNAAGTDLAIAPWNNKNDGNATGSAPLLGWQNAKAVRIPVTTGPVFAASLGLTPNPTSRYRIGKLRVTMGQRNCTAVASPNTHSKKSSYGIFMQNNNLLTTRAFSSGGASPHNETIAYGFTAAGAADVANASGSVQNATTTVADAIVQGRLKGDVNRDGFANLTDLTLFYGLVGSGTLTVEQTYCADFNNDRVVNLSDSAGMFTAISLSSTCP